MLPVKFQILLLLGLVVVMISGAVLYIQEQKKLELEIAIEQIKLQNLRIGVGSYGVKKGTGLFGTLVNKGDHIVNIATLLVHFMDDEGQIAKTHQFSPVNRYSWMDPKPLVPKGKKEFALLLDDIVPESWSGSFEVELIKLEFKE